MLTERERIGRLEETVVEIQAAIKASGAMSIVLLEAALDQMVDEGRLPASTRNEIFGRIRRELPAFRIASADLASGASGAIPRYLTKSDVETQRELMRNFPRPERDVLSARSPRPAGDPSPGSQPAEPEPE